MGYRGVISHLPTLFEDEYFPFSYKKKFSLVGKDFLQNVLKYIVDGRTYKMTYRNSCPVLKWVKIFAWINLSKRWIA